MTYQHVIRDDASRLWAKQANRRMLMIGEFYDQKKQISDEAKKQLAAYQDQGFANNIEQYASMVSESSLRKELMNDNSKKEEKTKTGDDSLLSVINKIGSLDLTGEKAAQKQEETERIRSELVAQGKLSAAEIKELDRRKALEENPYRRPGAIKSIIDENASQLKYLYNKRLRQGIKLSGKMVVEIAIKPDGSIRSAKIARSNMGDKGFEDEIVSQVLKWKFKSVIDSLGDMTVNYPMEFSEEE
jgi:TonB family protein